MTQKLDSNPQLESLEAEVNVLMRCMRPIFRQQARELTEQTMTASLINGITRTLYDIMEKHGITLESIDTVGPDLQPLFTGYIKSLTGHAEQMDEFEVYAVQHPFEMIDRAKGSPDPLTRVLALTIEYATALQLSKQHALSSSISRR
ncbi:MAG: hypothetical protein K2Q12_11340 [Rickettsiales bacterium]|nr:hypothetical protein [Rickettsiales bacterium]